MRVKLESRIAGFTFFDPVIICVVFRGGLFLDGVLARVFEGGDLNLEAANLLKSSTHFNQVNYVFLDGSNWISNLNLDFLYSILDRPVIAVFESNVCNSVFIPKFNLYACFRGVSLGVAEDLFGISTFNSLPEPLRIARLLALSLLDALSCS